MSSSTVGGKTFYSDSMQFLEGVQAGASYVNDGPIEIGNIEKSDNPSYDFMLVLTDSDDDEMQYEYC